VGLLGPGGRGGKSAEGEGGRLLPKFDAEKKKRVAVFARERGIRASI